MLARALILAATGAAALAPAAHARDPIVPLGDVHRGLACTARTVVHGTEISSFDVQVLDVVADVDGTGARILVRVSGPAVAESGIADGFSGSPVYCPDATGRIGNAGAISATIGQYGNDVALVTPIEQMLGLPVHPPSGVRRAPRLLRAARPLAAPLTIAGLSPRFGRLVERVARRHGRAVVAVPVGPLGTFPPQELVPGASLAVALSSGAIAMSGIGTVTYRDGATIYGFGHAFEGAGRRSLLLQDAYVFTVVANPVGVEEVTSYKLAAPGHTLGTISDDASAGVVGTLGASPRTFPVTVRVHDRDLDRTVRQQTDIVDEVDLGSPSGSGMMPAISSFAVAQAVTAVFDGAPAQQTGRLCVRARLRETPKPLRFCNRYVVEGFVEPGFPSPLALPMAGDVMNALDGIDRARFAALHLTEVEASASVERGLRLATIRSVRGPHRVRPGQRIGVALRVRLLRGPLRTLRFRLRVPRGVAPGPHVLRLIGTPADGEGGFDDAVEALFGLFGFGDPMRPQTMREVIARFAGAARYDGVTARIGKRRWHAFRSDAVRIDGRGVLRVRVRGAHRRGHRHRGRVRHTGPPPPAIAGPRDAAS